MDTGLFPARQAQHIAYREGYYKQGTGQEISTEAKLPHALQPASVPMSRPQVTRPYGDFWYLSTNVLRSKSRCDNRETQYKTSHQRSQFVGTKYLLPEPARMIIDD